MRREKYCFPFDLLVGGWWIGGTAAAVPDEPRLLAALDVHRGVGLMMVLTRVGVSPGDGVRRTAF